MVSQGITYLCMADAEFSRRLSFAFLEDVKNRFEGMYPGRGRTALAYGMNSDFARILDAQMRNFNTNPKADHLVSVASEVEDIKGIMVDNIDKVMTRGEQLELLVDKTSTTVTRSTQFKQSASTLHCTLIKNNIKLIAIGVAVIILVIYIICAMACGGLTLPNCGGGDDASTD